MSDDDKDSGSQLSPLMVAGITVTLTVCFVVNVLADIFVNGYNGYPTTAILGTIIGSVLGVGRFIKIGK